MIVLEQVPYKDNFYGNIHGRGKNLTLDEFYSKHASVDTGLPVNFSYSTDDTAVLVLFVLVKSTIYLRLLPVPFLG